MEYSKMWTAKAIAKAKLVKPFIIIGRDRWPYLVVFIGKTN